MTAKTIGLGPKGYGSILVRTILTKQTMESLLQEKIPDCMVAPFCDTNILCFCVAKQAEPLSETNARTLSLFEKLERGDNPFFVSKTALDRSSYKRYLESFVSLWGAKADTDELILIRMAMMNPFFSSKQTTTNFFDAFVEKVASVLAQHD